MSRALLACALALPTALSAQAAGEWPQDGTYSMPAIATSEAVNRCVTSLEATGPGELEVTQCWVAAVDSVELAEGSTALLVRYERWVNGSAIAWRDSVQVEEVVLYLVDPETRTANAEWRRVALNDFIAHPVWTGRHAGVDIFIVLNCARGTGGCVEDVLIRRDRSWQLAEMTFVDELEPHLPPDYSLHKGRWIDPSTLDFEQPIATRGDANCCPSAVLVGRLMLEGTRLRLAEAPELRRR